MGRLWGSLVLAAAPAGARARWLPSAHPAAAPTAAGQQGTWPRVAAKVRLRHLVQINPRAEGMWLRFDFICPRGVK